MSYQYKITTGLKKTLRFNAIDMMRLMKFETSALLKNISNLI